MNIIWRDLRFFIERLAGLRISGTLRLSDEGFCVSTDNEAENWVYYPAEVTSHDIARKAADFFAKKGESFMWPVYDGGENVLRDAGLTYAGELAAMSLDPEDADTSRVNPAVKIEHITSPELGRLWAKTAWYSFGGGEDDAPEDYRAFGGALAEDREGISMYIARLDGQPAGTFAVTHEPDLMGVYFVGTVPGLRRKGIAASMMNEVCRMSAGKKIVLQATPIGAKMYKAFGFKELFRIPVYSNEEDLF